jgi:hypothetical protein
MWRRTFWWIFRDLMPAALRKRGTPHEDTFLPPPRETQIAHIVLFPSSFWFCRCLFLAWQLLTVPLHNVKLSLCLTNSALRHEGAWMSGCVEPHFLDLGINCRWVVSFTPRPLYPRGKNRYPKKQEAGWAPEPFWRRREDEILDPTGTRTQTPRSFSP